MSKPFVYIGLSQAPGVYELTLMCDDMEVTLHGSLTEFGMLAQNIAGAVAEQRERDQKHEEQSSPITQTERSLDELIQRDRLNVMLENWWWRVCARVVAEAGE